MKKESILFGLLRLSLGWIFLWAFLDKVFGLGFATTPSQTWLKGISPTLGFLKFGTRGHFSSFFQNISGSPIVDWLFMLGLLGVGLSLILGIGLKISRIAGSLMMLFIWLAAFPPKQNPIIDEHIIYIISLNLIPIEKQRDWFGLGKWWSKTKLVKKYTWLR